MDRRRQRLDASKLETHWATLARKEGLSNEQQAKRQRTIGNFTLAKFYHREAKWDFAWARKRTRLAKRYRKF